MRYLNSTNRFYSMEMDVMKFIIDLFAYFHLEWVSYALYFLIGFVVFLTLYYIFPL